jgi:hypothetical protein
MKKDIRRSRKDYLVRHHLERTTGAGEIYVYFDVASLFRHLSDMVGIC